MTTTTPNRSAIRWVGLACLVALLLTCIGCGQRTEEARAMRMQLQAIEGAQQLNALPPAEDPAEHQAVREQINDLLTDALMLGDPVLAGLEMGTPVEVSTSVEIAIHDPVTFRGQATLQADKAAQAVEGRAWLQALGLRVLGWVEVGIKASTGLSLGLTGGGAGGLLVAGAWVLRQRNRFKKALEVAAGFGEEADALLKSPLIPTGVQQTWGKIKQAQAEIQAALKVKPVIDQAREPKRIKVQTVVVAPEAEGATAA